VVVSTTVIPAVPAEHRALTEKTCARCIAEMGVKATLAVALTAVVSALFVLAG
jgi:hypothetical protein